VCLIEAETVAAAAGMHGRGVRAHYIHLRPPSDDVLRRLVKQQLGNDPPLGYTPEAATAFFYDHVQSELAAASAATHVWDADIVLHEDAEAAYFSMMESIADRFTNTVPRGQVCRHSVHTSPVHLIWQCSRCWDSVSSSVP
jgi:hypothetical protein